MRLNALLLVKMNKYLLYRWSYSRKCYWPLLSCDSLRIARYCAKHFLSLTNTACIIVPNPHPRYAQHS